MAANGADGLFRNGKLFVNKQTAATAESRPNGRRRRELGPQSLRRADMNRPAPATMLTSGFVSDFRSGQYLLAATPARLELQRKAASRQPISLAPLPTPSLGPPERLGAGNRALGGERTFHRFHCFQRVLQGF